MNKKRLLCLLMLNASDVIADSLSTSTQFCLINATPNQISIKKVGAIDNSDWLGNFLPTNLTNQRINASNAACWPLTLATKLSSYYQFNIELNTSLGPISWIVHQSDATGEIDNKYPVQENETNYYLNQKAGDNNGFATNVFILEDESDKVNNFLSHWMQEIPNHYAFKNIQLIGTHDAGVNLQDGVNCNFFPAMAVTQKWNLEMQLIHGIRYFDIRLEEGEENLHYPYHKSLRLGCSSRKSFESSLKEIVDFIKLNTSETVFLKISHSAAPVKGIVAMLDKWTQSQINGKYFYKTFLDNNNWVDKTVKELRGKIVLLLDCEFNDYLNPAKGYFGFSKTKNGLCDADDDMKIIYDKYSNTLDFDYMYRDQLAKLAHHGKNHDTLFLLSWTMTGGDVVAHTARPAANLVLLSNQVFGKSLPLPNIVYYDFEDPGINKILVTNYLQMSNPL